MNTSFALALHTTTTKLELAIAKIDSNSGRNSYIIHKQQSWELGRELSVQLHDCLTMFVGDLKWTDFAFLAIATGIGSFTGTRIGIVVAKTLGEQLDIPVYGIDCDAIIARAQQSEPNLSLSESLLAIAYDLWQVGTYSNWQAVLPIYEQ
ncbi:MAG: tRNA (adenosine(37)-N6)-threonylcarbamoyltransferase complex dimerization subunit type 1 TsaB [Pseudanabaena sp. CAN_BIN31]|nr:tRNA (adenosine(37)-N6)-threonylcarbamoyltransferase complex dimerization subunit type 1 TsaB [Pseudanabaena sp. CAN_BIN31]